MEGVRRRRAGGKSQEKGSRRRRGEEQKGAHTSFLTSSGSGVGWTGWCCSLALSLFGACQAVDTLYCLAMRRLARFQVKFLVCCVEKD